MSHTDTEVKALLSQLGKDPELFEKKRQEIIQTFLEQFEPGTRKDVLLNMQCKIDAKINTVVFIKNK